MNKVVLCPGKIPIRNVEQPWYMANPNNDNNYIICECCYKHYGKLLEPICFKIVYGEKYHCSCPPSYRLFDKSSITYNNIRVSVINPDNFFRYRITKRQKGNNKTIFHIPKDEKYIIIVENMDNNKETKISVDIVNYDDVEVRYYDKKYPGYIIIDNEDYIAYNNLSRDQQHIDFVIKKWIKPLDPYLGNHYIKDSSIADPFFEFQLHFSEQESKIMNSFIEINKYAPDKTGKIILIDDFII